MKEIIGQKYIERFEVDFIPAIDPDTLEEYSKKVIYTSHWTGKLILGFVQYGLMILCVVLSWITWIQISKSTDIKLKWAVKNSFKEINKINNNKVAQGKIGDEGMNKNQKMVGTI